MNIICEDDGASNTFVALLAAGMLVVLGFVVEYAGFEHTRQEAHNVAAQAARAAAQELDPASVQTGGSAPYLSAAAASAAAQRHFATAGVTGSVAIAGDRVTVTVTSSHTPTVLAIVGPRNFTATATARAARVVDGSER